MHRTLTMGALVAVAVGLGCNPAGGPNDHTDGSAVPTPEFSPTAPLSIQLEGEPANRYQTLDRSTTVLAARMTRAVRGLKVDPCLERAARAHLLLPDTLLDGHLPLDFTEFALHWAGCPDPTGAVTSLRTNRTDLGVFLDQLKGTIETSDYTHVGAAVKTDNAAGQTRWIGLLVNRRMKMQPVATSHDPETSVALQFLLDPQFNGAVVAVTPPRGEVRISRPGISEGWVATAVPLGAELGEYWIELIGHDSTGPQVLALFPIQVGRPAAARWVGIPPPDESRITTEAEATEVAADLIMTDRSRFGLGPLVWDDQLAAVARAHSRDMAENGFFAHVSPTTGTIADRIREVDYPADFVAENIAIAPRLTEAQTSLMRSPGHRATILTTDATHFGVGVVTRTTESHGKVHHVTQVFARRGSLSSAN